MREAKEILFNHYDKDPDGGLLIDDNSILAAMEEFANEKLTAFMLNYIGTGASKSEVQRLIKQFDESEIF